MNQQELQYLVSSSSRKFMKFAWAGIVISIICINIPFVELGYWLFGASLTWLGLMHSKICGIKQYIRLGNLTERDSEGRITVECEGVSITADPGKVTESKLAPGYYCIEGTAILFKQ